MKKLRPVLDGEYWLIGPNPNLGELQGKGGTAGALPGLGPQQCVDHHVFKADDGMWHLWGCVRHTAIGRLLYHWKSPRLTDSNWEQTGEYIRAAGNELVPQADRSAIKEEFLMSPFIVRESGTYFMFYGAAHIGVDKNGAASDPEHSIAQMCLTTSTDGLNWERHRNPEGYSRVFLEPCSVRDPIVIKINGLWHMYYAGYEFVDGVRLSSFYLRTSKDLYSWSDAAVVHRNRDPKFGSSFYDTECPFVVEKEGYYYLFRTQDYGRAITHVFRSEDPADFSENSADYIGTIQTAATEIITGDDGQEYVTSSHDLDRGTHMCKLKWIPEESDLT